MMHVKVMTGYSTCAEQNLVVMAAIKGRRSQVVNIGLSVKVCEVDPPEATPQEWAQSLAHKVM